MDTKTMKSSSTLMVTDRRDLLKKLVGALGVACSTRLLSGTGLAVALAYPRALSAGVNAGKVFDVDAMKILAQVCALVIPATNTPSAADVDTHGFIDNQLLHCYTQAQQLQVNSCLSLIESVAKKNHNLTFVDCSEQQQLTLLNALDIGSPPFNSTAKDGFRFLKSLIAFGFFTSEVGATKALRYQAIPGGFKGSIPYRQGEASWAPNLWL